MHLKLALLFSAALLPGLGVLTSTLLYHNTP
jgi:hypothetical protein